MNQASSAAAIEEQPSQRSRPDAELLQRYRHVRAFSEQLAAPLSPEDCSIQSMNDASPTRWHLAHTTWFFETFLLKAFADYRIYDAQFEYLFNSYYNSVGEQFPQARRGVISRPGLEETLAYRQYVDEQVHQRLGGEPLSAQQRTVLETGLNHEQQHQELILTDIKHALAQNPLDPVYLESNPTARASASERSQQQSRHSEPRWLSYSPGVVSIGYDGQGFCFDNEGPRHRVFLEPFELASHCVTNAEYLKFIEDGGYRRPEFWLSHGWSTVEQEDWQAPLYWRQEADGWSEFTLAGRRPLELNQPVCHLSYFEADAFARWAGCRLPSEAEWEHAVSGQCERPLSCHQPGLWSDQRVENGLPLHPDAVEEGQAEGPIAGAFGNLWQWTSSHYSAYPGYQPAAGALGEYNGKFMCNVFVLRGGSCVTPSGHVRTTYRNFFDPAARWQFSGLRLARA